jgi:LysR family hydrogen peroxide-inducible transcriptional activator
MAEPTVRQLRYLAALADHLHFADAAADCGVSQPNLSAQIRELEKTLGVQLLERTSRHVLLTDVGERVVDRAHRVLTELEDLIETASLSDDPFAGRMRLGVIPTIAPYVLPRTLPVVRKTWPHLELQLIEDFTDRLLQRLRAGELDAALLALPVEQGGLRTEALVDEPFVVLAPKGHPISRSRSIKADAFDADDLLLLQEGHCLRDQALNLCHVQTTRRGIEGSSLTTLVQMVANGFGTTLLPVTALPVDLPSTNEVVVVPFTKPAPGRTIGLVWRQTSSRTDAFLGLADLLRAELDVLVKKATKSSRS